MSADGARPGEEERATRLLGLCRTRRRRAVDALIEHLELAGPGALEELLAAGPGAALARGAGDAEGPPPPLAVAEEVHERSKREPGSDPRQRLEGLAAYFTAVASALHHHGRRITRRPPEELEPVLVDLAAVTAGPWQELFLGALERAPGLPLAGSGPSTRPSGAPGA